MRHLCAVLALAALADCGVDGEPVRSTGSTTTTVGVGKNGVVGSTGATVISGKMSVHVGTTF